MEEAASQIQKLIDERRALLNEEVPLPVFLNLGNLEARKVVSLGVSGPVAGAAWRGETLTGKISGFGFCILLFAIPFTFWRLGWLAGIANAMLFFIYHQIQVAISSRWFRGYLLERPALFHLCYCQGNVVVRHIEKSRTVTAPENWMDFVQKLSQPNAP